MLFQTVDNLKRQTIMISIVLMAAGLIMVICPEEYMTTMNAMVGYAMVITALVWVLDFLSSNKTLIRYIYLTIALILGVAGLCVLFFKDDILMVSSWLFGVFLVLDGAYGVFNAMTYARRSERKGWGVLVFLCFCLVALGIVLIINPWWDEPRVLFMVIGFMLLFSAAVGALRLVWIWPARSE